MESYTKKLLRLAKQQIIDAKKAPNCAISLAAIRKDTRVGVPDSCNHKFCLSCIQNWSIVNNICPIDRIPFEKINVRKTVNSKPMDVILVSKGANNNLDTLSSDDQAPAINAFDYMRCQNCGIDDCKSMLLICDGCGECYHYDTCLPMPILSVPIGDWYCHECPWIPTGPIKFEMDSE